MVLPGVHAAPADLALGSQAVLGVGRRSCPPALKVWAIFAWFPPGLRSSHPGRRPSRSGHDRTGVTPSSLRKRFGR